MDQLSLLCSYWHHFGMSTPIFFQKLLVSSSKGSKQGAPSLVREASLSTVAFTLAVSQDSASVTRTVSQILPLFACFVCFLPFFNVRERTLVIKV